MSTSVYVINRVLVILTLSVMFWSGLEQPARAAGSAGGFTAAFAAKPLVLDASLADPQWQAGAIPGTFENLTTASPASESTSVSILYDARNLYVAFRARQAAPVIANQHTNDAGFGADDFVGVGIDPSGTGSQVYYFESTPLGTRYQQASEDSRFRPQWQAAAVIDAGEWRTVMIIPLATLKVGAESVQSWRLNFVRNIAARGEHYTFAYDGTMRDRSVAAGWPEFGNERFWPTWKGIKIVAGGEARRRADLDVYGLLSAGRDRAAYASPSGSVRSQAVRELGVDARYPITSTITAVGTLGPDVSGIEADQQSIAPREFARSLSEVRPFFVQGAAFINPAGQTFEGALTPPNAIFYSPSLGPVTRGEKIEGTLGPQSFGILNVHGSNPQSGNVYDDTAFGLKHATPDRHLTLWADGVLANHSLDGRDQTLEIGASGRNKRSGLIWGTDEAVEGGSYVRGPASSHFGFVDVTQPFYEAYLGYGAATKFYHPIDGITFISGERGFNPFISVKGSTRALKSYTLAVFGERLLNDSGIANQSTFASQLLAKFRNGFSINGAGPTISELDGSKYNLFTVPVGFGDGTSNPIDASVAFGHFGAKGVGSGDAGDDYLHLYTLSATRSLGRGYSLGVEYDGSFERALTTGSFDSQWLRRLTLGANLASGWTASVALRGINGRGGSAQPGTNVSAAVHRRFNDGSELFFNFGTPAANRTVDRFVVKYILHTGRA